MNEVAEFYGIDRDESPRPEKEAMEPPTPEPELPRDHHLDDDFDMDL